LNEPSPGGVRRRAEGGRLFAGKMAEVRQGRDEEQLPNKWEPFEGWPCDRCESCDARAEASFC